MRLRRAGERGWMLDLPEGSARVGHRLRAEFADRLQEVVPGHSTVLVVGDVPPAELLAAAERALAEPDDRGEFATVEIPVLYDGPDLDEVAALTGLSRDEVIALHAGATYTVAFLGFAPGFAYLVGLDPRLEVSRRAEPRVRVPAGAVAIAGPYSGVYPRESPGGWRLLGSADVAMFDPGRTPPALLAPGDRVRFIAR
jgi:KipI family sensor histidine kinase inhibitor